MGPILVDFCLQVNCRSQNMVNKNELSVSCFHMAGRQQKYPNFFKIMSDNQTIKHNPIDTREP